MRLITDDNVALLDDLLSRVSIELEITKSQRQSAESSYNSVGQWLAGEDSPLTKLNPTIYAQGSLRLDTTVKPKGHDEFDLDLVCEFSGNPSNLNPLSTLKIIENRLKEHGTYVSMVEPKNRCIRLNYAGQYHMDILPAYPDPSLKLGCLLVPDRKARDWKESAPKNYAKWFEDRCMYKMLLEKAAKIEPFPDYDLTDDKAPLKRIVQLMKRYRDIKYSECKEKAPISIIITTLAGHFYDGEYSVSEGVANILNKIKIAIPSTGRLQVLNPANPAEDFSEKWDKEPEIYNEFVDWISIFMNEWSNIRGLQNNIQLADKIKKMFGEEIAVLALEKQAAYIGHLREAGILKIDNHLGMLTGVEIAATAKKVTAGVIIPKNTFYGK